LIKKNNKLTKSLLDLKTVKNTLVMVNIKRLVLFIIQPTKKKLNRDFKKYKN